MRRVLLTMITTLPMFGCATTTPPVAAGYSGPVASVADTVRIPSGASCGEWYYLAYYNEKLVENALSSSIAGNQNNGLVFRDSATGAYSRPVPAAPGTFHIAGRTHCAAPIEELTRTMYLIHGVVSFTPEADHAYTIKGELNDDHGAVWVEDNNTKAQVGNRLFIQGTPKQGFFDQKGTVTQIPPPGTASQPDAPKSAAPN